MKPSMLTALALASCCVFSGAQARHPSARPTKASGSKMSVADWQKMYDQAEKLFDSRNADAVFQFMTPDFKLTMNGQTMSSAQAKQSMKLWFAMMKDLHCSMKVVSATGGATSATVTDKLHNTGDMVVDLKTHRTGKFVDIGTETATWVKKNGKWMMKSLVTKDEKMTVNGKPIRGM